MRNAIRHNVIEAVGFTLAELMIVVLVIGVLIAIVVPVFVTVSSNAERKTCFANQRTIEGAVGPWLLESGSSSAAGLVGVVNAAHPLVQDGYLVRPPRCPSAPKPVNELNPTAAEGAYSMDASSSVTACPFGGLGAHGTFHSL